MTPARPAFDPELLAALDALPRPDIDPSNLSTVRRALLEHAPSIRQVVEGTGLVSDDVVVPGPAGAPDITLAVVRDPGATRSGPGIYHIHGGGMMFGDRRIGAVAFPRWIKELGATVVSVDYRLAPEDPYPAGVEDCYAGLLWTAAHAAEIGIDPTRLLVAGASAGGGLAAAVALLARDRGGPPLVGQLLTSPMLDDRVDTVSAHQFERTPAPWSGQDDVRGWTALLGDARGTPGVSPYAAPARATDLSGLPSAFIEVGSAEVFRDEDVDYAGRIWAAGGQAELHVWAGAYHGFSLAPQTTIARRSVAAQVDWLHRLLGR